MSDTEGAAAHNDHHGHEEPFWRKYIFSVDHKVIGIQYGITSLLFLLLGFSLMLIMRWQLAYPGEPLPLFGFEGEDDGKWLTAAGVLKDSTYNMFGAMHGTIMVFLGVVPLSVGAFGNYVMPLQIGAIDMAFPRLNMASYWVFFVGGAIMLASFLLPEGPVQAGWTNYPPLAHSTPAAGQVFWLLGMVCLITSSLLGSVNFIVTIFQLRAEGLSFMRLPVFVWAQLVTAFLLLLAFPPLEAAGVLMLMDRLADTSFFMPSGLVFTGQQVDVSGGGSAILWQHLFWFLAHPEVYVLILPGFGIISEVISNNIRKPLYGYKTFVYALVFLGFMSFIVWAHHMFMTGMGPMMSTFFQTTTMIISVPSIVVLTVLLISLWGGRIRFNTPMLFALGFLPMFAIGGLTGLPLGLPATDIHLHDTLYVIGHFHYVVAPGSLMALMGGIYYWFPKITGRAMSERLGKIHFWGTFLCMNGIFMPMLIQGLAGVSRRLFDGGASYAHAQDVLWLNKVMSHSAFLMAAFQFPFAFNLIWSVFAGKKVGANPWKSTTLEWSAAPSPPVGHGNFETVPVVYRGAYDYSLPGKQEDYTPQNEAD